MTRLAMSLCGALALAGCASPGRVAVTPASDPATGDSAPWQRPGLGGAVRPEMGQPQPGSDAPDFELPKDNGEGGALRLSSLRGSWVLLHFTASWCPYCDSEVDALGAIADAYAGRHVKVVLVDVKEDPATWRAYAATHVAPSVIATHDEKGAAALLYAPPHAQPSFRDRAQVALDSTLIVDPEGTIRLFLLPDTAHFDPTFGAVRAELDRYIGARPDWVLPAEEVVDLSTEPSPAGRCGVVLTMRIAPGYHVMSDRPSAPEYIATRVAVEGYGAPEYPPAVPFELAGTSIATFQGTTRVFLPCAGAAPPPIGDAVVRYQACTRSRCLFPVTRHMNPKREP
jgi:peroxiredoxin